MPTKRSINFMILSLPSSCISHFEEDDLAGMAKEAGEKSVGAINYGAKQECDQIIDMLGRAQARKSSRQRLCRHLKNVRSLLQSMRCSA